MRGVGAQSVGAPPEVALAAAALAAAASMLLILAVVAVGAAEGAVAGAGAVVAAVGAAEVEVAEAVVAEVEEVAEVDVGASGEMTEAYRVITSREVKYTFRTAGGQQVFRLCVSNCASTLPTAPRVKLLIRYRKRKKCAKSKGANSELRRAIAPSNNRRKIAISANATTRIAGS